MGPVEGELIIMGANIMSDVVFSLIADMKSKGKDTITVAELELMAIKYKTMREEETDKIKERLQAMEAAKESEAGLTDTAPE